jgi:putative membrane protein
MIRIAAYAVGTIVATLIVAQVSSRMISFDSPETVIIFGLIAGMINAFIKPVVKLLTLPLTCLTFGLFAIVVNAGLFALGAWITDAVFDADLNINFWGAVVGSILASLASGLIFSVVDE